MSQAPDLTAEFAGIRLKSPVIAASGTFGYGEEFKRFLDLKRIGAVVVKGTSAKPIAGNQPPRLFPTASGMINSIGLENVGVDAFIRDKMPALRDTGCSVFVNVFGFAEEEYAEVIDKLNPCEGIAAYELNVSCPNTKHGGMMFGTDPQQIHSLTKMLKARSNRPLIVKMSPNVTDIGELARAAEAAGSDALTVAPPARRPVVGVGAVVVQDGRVLLIRRGKEPITTLARHRKWDGATWFGMNLIPDTPGATIRVGDEVRILDEVSAPDGPPR